MSTPGIYIETLQPPRLIGDLLRSDIAAFMGYARRGPTSLAVRIESWRQFLAVFGEPVEPGFLGPAVKGFFENGGVTCYILRLTDASATAASCQLAIEGTAANPIESERWEARASFRASDIVTSEEANEPVPDSAILQHFEPGGARHPVANPGQWGNALSISIERSTRLSTQTNGLFDEGFGSFVDSLVGLETHSVIQLSQEQLQPDGSLVRVVRYTHAQHIDPLRQSIIWPESLTSGAEPFAAESPVRIDTVEFDVRIHFENRLAETYRWLSPHPQHSNSLHHVLAEQSRLLNLSFVSEHDVDWDTPEFWPAEVINTQLEGGKDGLSAIAASDYLQGLAVLAGVEEVSVVAAPDLVLNALIEAPPDSQLRPFEHDCEDLSAPMLGRVNGLVTDGEHPLANVIVQDAQSGQRAVTNSAGEFILTNLELSLRTLRLDKSGFENEERQVPATTTNEVTEFTMVPLSAARSLTELEILQVQRAMLNPSQLGRFRVALLDPPAHLLKIEDIRNWRAKVGDSDRGALLYPWLFVPHPVSADLPGADMPPSGHIAGAMANMDIQYGPYRAAANQRLRYAKGVSQALNDVHLGLFNPEGISAIRSQPGQGLRLYGVRTLSSDPQWRYLPVRRLIMALSKTLETALQWVVFESNTAMLRQAVKMVVQTLLQRLWLNGALAGKTADAAFRIKCDEDNNPQAVTDAGQFILEIAVAPSVPFEFIRIRLGRTLDAIEVTE